MTVRQPTREGTVATPDAMRRRYGVRVGDDARIFTCAEGATSCRGPFVWRLQRVDYHHVQECACERKPRGQGERPETWPGFDFNTVAELRHACGGQVLHSGSRYSVWFCVECKERVRTMNAEIGQALVPIGRHTIMNGVGLQASPKPTRAEMEAFVARCGTMIDRIYRLDDWAHEVVHDNLVTIGRDDAHSVAIAEYLEAVRNLDRARHFDAMVAWMTLDRESS